MDRRKKTTMKRRNKETDSCSSSSSSSRKKKKNYHRSILTVRTNTQDTHSPIGTLLDYKENKLCTYLCLF